MSKNMSHSEEKCLDQQERCWSSQYLFFFKGMVEKKTKKDI